MTHHSGAHDTYSLLFDVFVLGHEVRRLLADAMEGGPLRPEEYAVYSVVFEEEAITQTAMSTRLSLPLTTIAEYVRAMEARDHVRRTPNPRDGRSHLLMLSGGGLAAHREANRRFEAAYTRLIAGLPADEGDIRRALRALRLAARAAADTGASAADVRPPAAHARAQLETRDAARLPSRG